MQDTAAAMQPRERSSSWVDRWVERTRSALAAAVVALLLGALTSSLMDDGRSVVAAYNSLPQGAFLVLFIVFATTVGPVLETAVMGALLKVLVKRLHPAVAIAVSAMAWALYHRIDGPAGWVVFLPFVVYSYVYLARQDRPQPDGFAVASMAHAFHNVFAFAIVVFESRVELHF